MMDRVETWGLAIILAGLTLQVLAMLAVVAGLWLALPPAELAGLLVVGIAGMGAGALIEGVGFWVMERF